MSNYRRLISYIYAYEGGVKGKNIGYAKVEIRADQCRIHVNVKKVYVGSNDIGVYLLAPDMEILLGKIFIRGGVGEFRIAVPADNVEKSGISIDQCYGLTVHDMESTWQCYTTIWEDAVAQSAEIQLSDVTAENKRLKEIPDNQEELHCSVSDEIEQEINAQEEEQKSNIPWEQVEDEEMGYIEKEKSRQEEQGDSVRAAELEGAPAPNPTPDMTKPIEMIKQIMPMIFAQKQAQSVDTKPTIYQESALKKTQMQEAEPIPELEDAARLEELDRMEQAEREKVHIWSQLGKRYAKVLAFDYDNGCEILSIQPQDIGLLPRDIWIHGNNSFLLHGYYNYRHLILARLNNPQGAPRYLLGVPGHYFSNEKHMASMFGFPHFVLAKRQPKEDGRFGYWYTDIHL